MDRVNGRRSPHGERGLKYQQLSAAGWHPESLPARGAWIEIYNLQYARGAERSLPARGAWIEIELRVISILVIPSLPARGAWIEIISDLLS